MAEDTAAPGSPGQEFSAMLKTSIHKVLQENPSLLWDCSCDQTERSGMFRGSSDFSSCLLRRWCVCSSSDSKAPNMVNQHFAYQTMMLREARRCKGSGWQAYDRQQVAGNPQPTDKGWMQPCMHVTSCNRATRMLQLQLVQSFIHIALTICELHWHTWAHYNVFPGYTPRWRCHSGMSTAIMCSRTNTDA